MAIHPDMLEQARRFHQAGKLAEAERAYQQILQANGHDAEVWYQLGDAVLGQGRLEEAAERFRQARIMSPPAPAWASPWLTCGSCPRRWPSCAKPYVCGPTSPKRITTSAWPWPSWASSTRRPNACGKHSLSSPITPKPITTWATCW